ncbi:DUF2752 domain-containing protein [Myxococcota bacterium]|nr:DUF2752 domain-containing protein [Myxococcota bacterium]
MSAAASPTAPSWARETPTSNHVVALCAALLVVGASILLDPSREGATLFGVDLPPMCALKALTGLRCPGCGLTRSFGFMGEGSPLEALRMHLFGPALWIFVAAQIPYRLMILARRLSPWNAPARGVSE